MTLCCDVSKVTKLAFRQKICWKSACDSSDAIQLVIIAHILSSSAIKSYVRLYLQMSIKIPGSLIKMKIIRADDMHLSFRCSIGLFLLGHQHIINYARKFCTYNYIFTVFVV